MNERQYMHHLNDDYEIGLWKAMSVQPIVNKLILPEYSSSGPISVDDQEGILVNDPLLEVVGHGIFKNHNYPEEDLEYK